MPERTRLISFTILTAMSGYEGPVFANTCDKDLNAQQQNWLWKYWRLSHCTRHHRIFASAALFQTMPWAAQTPLALIQPCRRFERKHLKPASCWYCAGGEQLPGRAPPGVKGEGHCYFTGGHHIHRDLLVLENVENLGQESKLPQHACADNVHERHVAFEHNAGHEG